MAADIFAMQTAQAPTATGTSTPTPTPTPTLTLTPTPTNTPTITPTPTPHLMAAVLTLDDLPGRFDEIPAEGLSEFKKMLPEGTVAFGFADDMSTQGIIGYFLPCASRAEQIAFDHMMPEYIELLAAATGASPNARC
jgi:hypothetical protein